MTAESIILLFLRGNYCNQCCNFIINNNYYTCLLMTLKLIFNIIVKMYVVISSGWCDGGLGFDCIWRIFLLVIQMFFVIWTFILSLFRPRLIKKYQLNRSCYLRSDLNLSFVSQYVSHCWTKAFSKKKELRLKCPAAKICGFLTSALILKCTRNQ